MNDLNNDVTEIPEGCTCHEEYVTAPCPIHSQTVIKSEFGKDTVVVTDDFLTPEIYSVWEGFIFECPVCGVPGIMVNKDMGKFCNNCGRSVVIRSKTVTEFVRNLANKQNRQNKQG